MIANASTQLLVAFGAVIVGATLSWIAYMAKQLTAQASLNAKTAAALETLQKDHDQLSRKVSEHMDDVNRRHVADLEAQVAALTAQIHGQP